jgi:lipopolysaccharide export system protein LptA
MSTGKAAALAVLAVGLGLATPSCAQSKSAAPGNALGLAGQDSGKPISITADKGVEWQQSNQVYIARGNAKATRGETSVSADTLYAYYGPAPTRSSAKAAPPPGIRDA